MSVRILWWAVVSFLALYFAVGMIARYTRDGTEDVYPFFSWSLFAEVPARVQRDFAVRILADGERTLDAPVFLEQAPATLYSSSRSASESYFLARSLAIAIKQNTMGSEREIERLRRAIEEGFPSHPTLYEVTEVVYDPIDRWRNGSVMSITPLAGFTSPLHE